MKKEKGKIITLTSSKGGVGKTILLLNLAGIYEKLEKKVLILDFDFSSGNCATLLNVDVKNTIYQVCEDIKNNRYNDLENYISHYSNYIDIIPCPKDPRQSTKIDVKNLVTFLDEIVNLYDVVLIDTTHGFSKNNILTLDLSDKILYVVTNDFMDLKNTKNFISIMKDASYDKVKIVLNESRDPNLNYFSTFDIKSTIKANIDYTISASMYIKNITRYILEGKIFTLNNSMTFKDKKDMNKMIGMAKDLLLDE